MYALYIFTFAIAVFLFVDALPYEQPKVYTIPLNLKSTTRRRAYNAYNTTRRALEHMPMNQVRPDVIYFGKIAFGTGRPQEFDILFDTGSADLFVINSYCKSPGCRDKPKYDVSFDRSLKVALDGRFQIKYNSGAVKGVPATTTMKIGSLQAKMQDFGLAYKVSDEFAKIPVSGIMGMGFSSASRNNQRTLITNLIDAGALDQQQFSFMLGRNADNTPSELTIGGSNTERYDVDSLTWTNLADDNRGLWDIPLENCFINDEPLNIQGRTGVIDTGTTSIILPPDDANSFYSKIPKSKARSDGTFLIPCEDDEDDEDDEDHFIIGLRFGGKTWNMDYRDFVIKERSGVCVGSIEAGKTGADTKWEIGIAFLKNVYTIFDQGNGKVGFGSLK